MVRPVENYASVNHVLKTMMRKISRLPEVESVGIKAAYGRVAAEDMAARVNIPEFTTSHMDGFAIISDNVKSATLNQPVKLLVRGKVNLGVIPRISVRPREAVRVATGSRVPAGADGVVPLEDVEERGKTIVVKSSIKAGNFIYQEGEDLRKGEVGVAVGTTIRAQEIGLLATLGVDRIKVFARPRVGILATGSELTDSGRPPGGKVRNSHTPVFERMVQAVGCIPLNMGIARDDERELRSKVLGALGSADLVLTLGGTSVGEHDLLGNVIAELDPKVFFHGIRMDRGRVTGVAIVQERPVVMMPGPIQGAMNAFALFALPILRRLQGRKEDELTARAEFERGWEARGRFSNFTKVVYVRLHTKRGRLLAEPAVAETESMRLLTRSNGFVVVPEGITSLRKREEVGVLLLPGFSIAG